MAASLALVLLATAAQASDADASVRERLARQGAKDQRTAQVVQRELVALGSAAIPALFAVYASEEALLPTDGRPVDPERDWILPLDELDALCLAALLDLPAGDVLAHVKEQLESPAPEERLDLQLRAFQLVCQLDSRAARRALPELLGSLPETVLRSHVYRTALGAALGDHLRHRSDPDAWSRPWESLPSAAQLLVLEALEEWAPRGARDLVCELAGQPELAPDVRDRCLDVAVALQARTPWREEADVRPLVRRSLESDETEVLCRAARRLGDLEDAASAPDLIALLGDHEPQVVRAAEAALERLANRSLEGDRQGWEAWWRAEARWWESEAERLAALAEADSPAGLVRSLREWTAHPLFREELGAGITPLLDASGAGTVALVCEALVQLRARQSAPALASALFSAEGEDAKHLRRALVALTGVDHGVDPWEWQAFLEGSVR